MSWTRRLVFCAFATWVALGSACSVNLDAAGVGARGDLDVGSSTGSGNGGGGISDDSGIEVGATSPEDRNPYERFAHLCVGGCTPGGDPVACAPGGDSGAGGGSPQRVDCRLVLQDAASVAQCAPVGTFEVNGPCQTGADCAAGLGCAATEGMGGVCRQYCCGNVEDCAPGTYCDARPMAESAGSDAPIDIPVCSPATNCELLNESACPAGKTCTIVREDGTTSCVEPGAGRANEACPCAPGFVCSMLTNQCKKLCRIDNGLQECGMGAKCQGGSMAYPAGFGVCVGGDY
jgi:hypothetical protein